jgi:hypothetical protein
VNNKSIIAQSSASDAEQGEACVFILLSSLIVSSEHFRGEADPTDARNVIPQLPGRLRIYFIFLRKPKAGVGSGQAGSEVKLFRIA